MTRVGPRDTGGSARTGWIRRASACEAVSPIASARRIEDNGTYVLSIDECVAGEKAPRDTFATIERPIPNVRRLERHRLDHARSAKNRKGERRLLISLGTEPGRAVKRRSGNVRRLAAAGQCATRLACAAGDQTSGEVPDRRPDGGGRAGRVADLPVVPGSADCFGANGRSRARTPRRRRNVAHVMLPDDARSGDASIGDNPRFDRAASQTARERNGETGHA
jgi:hypothetical protein